MTYTITRQGKTETIEANSNTAAKSFAEARHGNTCYTIYKCGKLVHKNTTYIHEHRKSKFLYEDSPILPTARFSIPSKKSGSK